jgi:hypothetical protein
MKRRDALQLTASLLGGTIIGSEFFLSGCKRKEIPTELFSEKDVAMLDEIGEIILPESDRSPGAKAANIGDFMKTIVLDCYDEKERSVFVSGLSEINQKSSDQFHQSFMETSGENRLKLLLESDLEARKIGDGEIPHFFTMMKQLTIWGYFSSEVGATKALRYNPIPGKYIGCVDYKVGEGAWS